MELTGKTTNELTRVDGNFRITYEVVRESGKLTWIRLRIRDISLLSEVGNGYYNANLGSISINYSKADLLSSEQRIEISQEFLSLVNKELEEV